MPKLNIKNLLIVFGILIVLPVSITWAQSAMPNLVPSTQSTTSTGVQKYADDPLLNAPMTAEGERASFERRQIQRQQEFAVGGFKWVSWANMGDQTMAFIKDRDPELKMMTGDPKFRDVAVMDIDKDNAPDVVTYDWTDCVSDGCPAVIYFSNRDQKPVSFIVRVIKPVKHGVTVDGTYYEF